MTTATLNHQDGLYANNLSLSRGDQLLLEDAQLFLPNGSITYLYGENGTGKTSLMRCLAGLLSAENGQIQWQGHSIFNAESQYFQQLIFLAHALAMKSELTIAENLQFYGQLRGLSKSSVQEKILQATQQLGLDNLLERRFAELSAGQQHKVALCRLLIEPAKIWILDEPFVNLDHKTRLWSAEQIQQFSSDGGVVLFTSHHEIDEIQVDQKIGLHH